MTIKSQINNNMTLVGRCMDFAEARLGLAFDKGRRLERARMLLLRDARFNLLL